MIRVEQLFYNTPARLKHIRSLRTEVSHITNYMNRFALSNPHISFEFINDGNQIMKTVGNGDIRQAIASVYGVNIARKMRKIEAENFDFRVSGYTSLPEVTRANNSYITLIVNGRYIHNYHLNRSVIDGYASTLMIGRNPISVINIEMDPLLLDVNVHPTKQQVRISNEAELGKIIKEAIHKQMHQEVRIPSSSDPDNDFGYGENFEDYEQQQFKFQSQNKARDFSFPERKQTTPSFSETDAAYPEDNVDTQKQQEVVEETPPDLESLTTHSLEEEESSLDLAKQAEQKNYN